MRIHAAKITYCWWNRVSEGSKRLQTGGHPHLYLTQSGLSKAQTL